MPSDAFHLLMFVSFCALLGRLGYYLLQCITTLSNFLLH